MPETSNVTRIESPTGQHVQFGFYVGPRVEGKPESFRSRAVIQAGGLTLDVPAADVDAMCREWLNARGQFDLEAFQRGLRETDALMDAVDAETEASSAQAAG